MRAILVFAGSKTYADNSFTGMPIGNRRRIEGYVQHSESTQAVRNKLLRNHAPEDSFIVNRGPSTRLATSDRLRCART